MLARILETEEVQVALKVASGDLPFANHGQGRRRRVEGKTRHGGAGGRVPDPQGAVVNGAGDDAAVGQDKSRPYTGFLGSTSPTLASAVTVRPTASRRESWSCIQWLNWKLGSLNGDVFQPATQVQRSKHLRAGLALGLLGRSWALLAR